MASHQESLSMALFCDFENVALGVRDAQYEKFDIRPVLERLLLKGSIVVKKAYCDWDRYKAFKAAMHEANFELIEIPHVRQSGKNSADIRLVVDALDLCYTKSHVDTFVIISGDSDFSPLVSKLRENAKQVIGVGIKQSTSDLLIANCDEFIFYDDLVRESQRASTRREPRSAQSGAKRSPEDEKHRKEELEARRSKAIDLAVATFDALVSERGDSGKMWASVLKEAIKRRRPDFNESYYGFRAFGNLLEAAQQRGLLEVGRDEKSGTYVFRSQGADETDLNESGSHQTPVRRGAPGGSESGTGEAKHTDTDEAARLQNESGPAEPTPPQPHPAEVRRNERRQARSRKAEQQAHEAHAPAEPAVQPAQTSGDSEPAELAAGDARTPVADAGAAPAPAEAASTEAAAEPRPAEPSGTSGPAADETSGQGSVSPRPAKAAKTARGARKAARKATGAVAAQDAAQAQDAEPAPSEAAQAPADASSASPRRPRKRSAKSATKSAVKTAA